MVSQYPVSADISASPIAPKSSQTRHQAASVHSDQASNRPAKSSSSDKGASFDQELQRSTQTKETSTKEQTGNKTQSASAPGDQITDAANSTTPAETQEQEGKATTSLASTNPAAVALDLQALVASTNGTDKAVEGDTSAKNASSQASATKLANEAASAIGQSSGTPQAQTSGNSQVVSSANPAPTNATGKIATTASNGPVATNNMAHKQSKAANTVSGNTASRQQPPSSISAQQSATDNATGTVTNGQQTAKQPSLGQDSDQRLNADGTPITKAQPDAQTTNVPVSETKSAQASGIVQQPDSTTPVVKANSTAPQDEQIAQTIPLKGTVGKENTSPTVANGQQTKTLHTTKPPEPEPVTQASKADAAVNSQTTGIDPLAQTKPTQVEKSASETGQNTDLATSATQSKAQKEGTPSLPTNGADQKTANAQVKSAAQQASASPDDTKDAPLDEAPALDRGQPKQNTLAERSNGALQAPKGDAFSKLMAQLNSANENMPLSGTGESDPAAKSESTPAAIQPNGESTTIRLTGMEALARGGNLPSQASVANSQALAAQISRFAQKGETHFEIRLDPAELGKVDVRLTIGSDGQTRAHMFVERSETLDFLMRDQRVLERALQNSGLDLDKQGLEFSLMDQNNQQQFANQSDQQNNDGAHISKSQDTPTTETTESISQHGTAGNGRYLATSGVNLVV